MFNNLVESGSHRRELARKGRFMLGTLALYGVLLAASGVASVVAYDARLERQSLELTSIITPVPVESARPADEPPLPSRAGGARNDAVIERATATAQLNNSTAPPDTVSAQPNRHKELPGLGPYRITDRDFDPTGGGGSPVGPHNGNPSGHGSRERAPVRVDLGEDVLPPTPAPTPAPTPRRPEVVRVPSSVISGKVLSKPVPAYPVVAKAARISGTVNVEILIDERGVVISARAVDGPALLRQAAETAARQARFTPTSLSGQPVKVSGVITYNFVLN